MLRVFGCILWRDIRLALRDHNEILTPLLFFLIIASLFPMATHADHQTLRLIGPGVIWVCALLASMLALERLFTGDYQDGSIDQLILTPEPLSLIIFAKVTAHWMLTGLPLTLIAPLIGMQYQFSNQGILTTMVSLAIATPTLSLIGAIGASLTLGVRGGGVLLSLLTLPLYIPLMIYGAAMIAAGQANFMESLAYLYLLASLLLFAMVLAPLAAAAGIRISLQ